MRKKTKKIVIIAAIVIVLGTLLMLTGNDKVTTQVSNSSIYDSFAQCITDSGAEMYGAYWCPVCNDQKKAFGSAQDSLPYIECSLTNSRQQTISCKKSGIEAYPTWKFPDGTEEVGKLSLEDLSTRTNCPLPSEHEMPVDTTISIENTDIIDPTTSVENIETELIFKSTSSLQGMAEIVEVYNDGSYTYSNNLPYITEAINISGSLEKNEYNDIVNFLNESGIENMKFNQPEDDANLNLLCEGGIIVEVQIKETHNILESPCVDKQSNETLEVTKQMDELASYITTIVNSSYETQ